ncbi:hypothetical protein PIB30_032427 [Stylosanthes scabra]|uniref:CCHC-type domain-containing protein n=1 Tax=Stylosanthes scabra TaxID=79078 RepID=A0ABU6Z9V9_9FABA|nr:hypothetical protein [Stylosanthes scabra]
MFEVTKVKASIGKFMCMTFGGCRNFTRFTNMSLCPWETHRHGLRIKETFVANIRLRRMGNGRPKITRYLNEMERQVCGPRKCSLCGRIGHSRSRCPQRAGPSADGS